MQGNLQCSECGWLLPGILDVSNEGVLDHQNMGTHKLIYLGKKILLASSNFTASLL